MVSRLPACLLALLCAAVPASAQDTRAEQLERERAAKARKLAPYQPSKVESALIWMERSNPLIKIAPFNGFYLQYGYSEKPIGSGIALGGGWRHDLFDRNVRAVVETGASLRGYRYVRGDVSLPQLAGERLELGLAGTYRKEPQEDFYGLGIDSRRDDRTDFLYEAPEVQGRVVFKPARRLHAGVRAGYLDVTVENGTDHRFPDIGTRFSDAAAPGLGAQPSFTYGDLFVTFDGRDNPFTARSGAYYNVSWRRYDDNGLDRYGFDRLDADLQHFLGFFGGRRVIASRVRMIATEAREGGEVPFYFQPTLGGAETLRSASDLRYRDRNMLVATVEYRWEAFSGLDMALFTDVGSVAPRVADLDLGQKHAYGLGFRFNARQAVWLRIDVANGSDGAHMFIKFSGNF